MIKPIKLIVGAALVGIFATVSWISLETMIELTGDETFCASCHTMKPMAAAYREDVHGGKNTWGIQAKCVDCHLPHNNSVNYLFRKAVLGTHDVFAEFAFDLDKIDWVANLENREDFVYDSGCLHCHTNLEAASERNNKMFVAHKPYFLGETQKHCVSCHQKVGHKGLKEKLLSSQASKE